MYIYIYIYAYIYITSYLYLQQSARYLERLYLVLKKYSSIKFIHFCKETHITVLYLAEAFVYIYLCVCICVCVCICMYIYMHIYIYIYIYIQYMYIHILNIIEYRQFAFCLSFINKRILSVIILINAQLVRRYVVWFIRKCVVTNFLRQANILSLPPVRPPVEKIWILFLIITEDYHSQHYQETNLLECVLKVALDRWFYCLLLILL